MAAIVADGLHIVKPAPPDKRIVNQFAGFVTRLV